MKDKKLFPELPEDINALSGEELTELRSTIQAQIEKVKTRDPEVLGELTMREVLEQTTAAVQAIEAIDGVTAGRVAAETDFEAKLAEITDGVAPPAAEEPAVEEPVAEADEPVVETPVVETPVEAPAEEPVVEVAEPVLVAAADIRAARKVTPVAPRIEVSENEDPKGFALTASSGIPGFEAGSALDSIKLAEAMVTKRYQGVSTPAGFSEKVLVASADWSHLYPEARRFLSTDSIEMLNAKIRDVVSVEALVASGGLCAPVTPYYELMNVAVANRPVRDAIASFAAVRGGLQFAAPPTIADVTTGVGIKTEAEDAAGGTFAAKTCQVVACPDFDQVDLSMIYRCLQFGNLNSRAFPEMVAQFNELTLAAHARLAEEALLDGIGASSTAVTTGAVYGATSSIIYGLLRAASGMRSRLRMDPNVKLRVLAPEWLPDLIAADLVNSQFIRFEYARQDIEALLERYGVTVSWYLDTETGDGQIFGAQSAGALLDFPDTVVYYMFPEGSYLFLDGGSLDLGIVRDSTLNETNDFQIFAETFENIAFVGPESLKVTATVCPSGTTGPTATAITC